MADPLGLANAVIWLDASDSSTIAATGGLVDTWTDKSGAGNNATATTTARPTTGTRYLNGKNVLDFDGSANQMNIATLNVPFTFTMGAVFQSDVSGDSAYHVIMADVAGGFFVGMYNTNQWALFSGGAALLQGTTDTRPHAAVWLGKTSPNAAIRIDGTETTGNGGSTNWTGGIRIGGASGSYFNGILAELVVYTAEVSAANRVRLNQYFQHKWIGSPAITITTPKGMRHPRTIKRPVRDQAGAAPDVSISLALTPAEINVAAQTVTPTAGGVSPALTPATVTVAGQTLARTAGGVSQALSPATIPVTAQALGATFGPAPTTLALTPASVAVTSSAFGILNLPPSQSMALTPATVIVAAQAQAATFGGTSVILTPATVAVSAQVLGTTPGAASTSLTPASVLVAAQGLSSAPGGLSRALAPATVVVAAQALDVSTTAPGTSLGLTPASVVLTPVALATTGAVTAELLPASVTVSPQPLAESLGTTLVPLTPSTITVGAEPVLVFVAFPQSVALTPAEIGLMALQLDPVTGLYILVYDIPPGPDVLQEAVWDMGSGYWLTGSNL